MKKKYLRISLCGISLLTIFGIIIGFSTSWKKIETISIAGSSSVSPLLTEYSSIYEQADVNVQAGGSSVGISSIINQTKNIGMASKNPNGLIDNEYKEDWKEKKIKTITIAWDGIGIVYKPVNNEQLNITDQNIALIYKAFSGHLEVSFKDLTLDKNSSTKPLMCFSRDGGAEKSGTAEAFFKNSNLTVGSLSEDIVNALEKGSYGRNVKRTAESNIEAWSYIKDFSAKENATMIYLSAGFIVNNLKEIENTGFKVAKYNNEILSIDKISKGYNWYRPLNIIVSLSNISQSIKDFILWTIDPLNEKRNKILNSLGFVALSSQQNKTMSINDNLWVFDYELGYCGAK